MLADTLIHLTTLGGLGSGVWLGCSFLISQSLSTGGQGVVFPWPKIGVVLDFPKPRGAQAGPGRPLAGLGRLREASWSFLGPLGPSQIQENPKFGRWANTHSQPVEKLSEFKKYNVEGFPSRPPKSCQKPNGFLHQKWPET